MPSNPGVYRFLNDKQEVIYVGKAKNLKKRVSSYFISSMNHSRKSLAMISKICTIEHTVVESEVDAFLLENNMIKSLQPKYNILLKDDKTYPWIVVRNEPFPRILSTRNYIKDGSKYFGPYGSVVAQKSILELVRKLYFVRTCHLKLTEENIKKDKFSLCLEYHIGGCKAPCEARQSRSEYDENIVLAKKVLAGNLSGAKQYLTDMMTASSEQMRFEEAQKYKDRLVMLTNYQSKSVVVSPLENNIDVFSIIVDINSAFCNYLHISKGAIIYSYSIEMKLGVEESKEDILAFAMDRMLQIAGRELSLEVIVPFMPDESLFARSVFIVPKRGDKLKLLELSEKNCRIYRISKLKNIENTSPQKHADRITAQMQKDLGLDEPPIHIECFDNSNIQGSYPVAACVVFRDAKPYKKDYRLFNIKTVVGIDDFASMREVVMRRYTAMLESGDSLPQLIVVDGGKGQLSMAYGVLKELKLADKIAIVGLAKRMEEIYFPNDPYPLCLDKSGDTLKILMQIRDEAHRFGITFHRNKRSKGAISSILHKIPSLGAMSVNSLLRKFKTISAIKQANTEALADVVGQKRAEAIQLFFKENESATDEKQIKK